MTLTQSVGRQIRHDTWLHKVLKQTHHTLSSDNKAENRCFLADSCRGWPFSRRPCKYFIASSSNGRQHFSLLLRTTDLNSLANGFLEFRMSNKRSTMRMNWAVASTSANLTSLRFLQTNSRALATYLLNVWAAKLTFIFCWNHSIWFLCNLFAAFNPSLVCSSWRSLMYCHRICFPLLSVKIPLSANVLLISAYVQHQTPYTLSTSHCIWPYSSPS